MRFNECGQPKIVFTFHRVRTQNDASEAVSDREKIKNAVIICRFFVQFYFAHIRYGRVVARVFLIRYKYVIHRVRTPNNNTKNIHTHTHTHSLPNHLFLSRHIHSHQSFSNGNGTRAHMGPITRSVFLFLPLSLSLFLFILANSYFWIVVQIYGRCISLPYRQFA